MDDIVKAMHSKTNKTSVESWDCFSFLSLVIVNLQIAKLTYNTKTGNIQYEEIGDE